MTKKQLIILIAVILTAFSIIITILLINRFKKPKVTDDSSSLGSKYAQNEVIDHYNSEEDDSDTSSNTSSKMLINDSVELLDTDKLTPEQKAVENSLIALLNKQALISKRSHGEIIEAKLTDDSNKFHAYVEVLFEDDYTETYVISYDSYNTLNFMRCVTLDQWNEIQNGANAG